MRGWTNRLRRLGATSLRGTAYPQTDARRQKSVASGESTAIMNHYMFEGDVDEKNTAAIGRTNAQHLSEALSR